MTVAHALRLALFTFAPLALAVPTSADDPAQPRRDFNEREAPGSFSLHDTYPQLDSLADSLALQDTAGGSQAGATQADDDSGVLSGPYFLRSADPEPLGELELKFVYGYETASDEPGENEFEFVLEWGIAEDLEFILEAGVVIGNGAIVGNGDIDEFGFHIRHWKEDNWMPAFATRHLIRIPTGYQSSGVDYTLRGLFTKTIMPDRMRLHFNPFLKSVNGDNDEDARNFQWGAAIGIDYRCSDDLVLIADYQYRTSEEDGQPDNHSLELGADWRFADHQKLGLSTEIGIDGDESGPNWGFKISYICSFDVGGLSPR